MSCFRLDRGSSFLELRSLIFLEDRRHSAFHQQRQWEFWLATMAMGMGQIRMDPRQKKTQTSTTRLVLQGRCAGRARSSHTKENPRFQALGRTVNVIAPSRLHKAKDLDTCDNAHSTNVR